MYSRNIKMKQVHIFIKIHIYTSLSFAKKKYTRRELQVIDEF